MAAVEDKTVLTAEALAAALPALTGWEQQGKAIVRRYLFGTFGDITRFMRHLAETIAATNHHPDVILCTTTRSVTVTVTTHSAGRVTQADLDFAVALNQFT
ncbi:MAG: 4a-hydroxytetrahydrobiopterin dehydratase [Fimbriimonadaceae bacterium]|nr:4a-hydroxytetrahydrobiopterin dehydratase [Fimbriimonadaceae bacterium]